VVAGVGLLLYLAQPGHTLHCALQTDRSPTVSDYCITDHAAGARRRRTADEALTAERRLSEGTAVMVQHDGSVLGRRRHNRDVCVVERDRVGPARRQTAQFGPQTRFCGPAA
jgi:hypothetical protein